MIRRYLNYRWPCALIMAFLAYSTLVFGEDLAAIQKHGVLRHLGIPDACFVTGGGDGLNNALTRLDSKSTGL